MQDKLARLDVNQGWERSLKRLGWSGKIGGAALRLSLACSRLVVAELRARQQDIAHQLRSRRQAVHVQARLLRSSTDPLKRLLDLGICGACRDDRSDHAIVEIADQVSNIVSRPV
jgi:hypothetical protein